MQSDRRRRMSAVLVDDALNVFADGSSLPSPRRGGIGIRFVLIDEEGLEQIDDLCPPGYKGATNNEMELMACIIALKEAKLLTLPPSVRKIVIHTDSTYVCENFASAKYEWPKTGWLTRSGGPVLNADLWKTLVKAATHARRRVEFIWVKGHAKNVHNRAADKLAKASANSAINPPISPVVVRRKRTSESVCPGSVAMLGQRLSIRVITSEYLRVQGLSKYKYEVTSRRSPYRGNVDIIYGGDECFMKAGHSYLVKVNEDAGNPTVMTVSRELKK